ncbi:potassium/proton antiporter [Reinekea forsetii]|nr:potassium/proton antiporter [Reinekea forsetii]
MTVELTYLYIFGAATLAFISVVASFFTHRTGAPILLVFLVLGMLVGEDGIIGVEFNDFNIAFLLGHIALAIIIFDGGLGTRKDSFRVSLKPALSLATVGVLGTAAFTGLAAHFILNVSVLEGFLIGAIVGSTDAAAVFGLIRNAGVELKERTSATLEIESGSNDPMAIFLTITLVELLMLGDSGDQGWTIASELLQQMGLGMAVGFAGGYCLVETLRRVHLPSSSYPLLALAGAMSLFGVTMMWGGSGFLAIFIMGVIIGNKPLTYSSDIHSFSDGVAWLSQIGMFLMLGMLVTPSELLPIVVPALGIAAVLIFVARPIAVFISLLPFHFPWREQVFISWCGLRGAVPIILALFPYLAGLNTSQMYFELVFFVVLISLVVQGWTIAPVAKWLKIKVPVTASQPDYVHLTLPDVSDKELLVYPVLAGSQVQASDPLHLPSIEGSQMIGVIRKGVLLNPSKGQRLSVGDRVLFLAGGNARAVLGRAFAPEAHNAQLDANRFFGEFTLQPTATLADIASVYGLDIEEQIENQTVKGYILQQFHGKPVVGDQVKLGSVSLIVREITDDQISAVGIKLK